MKIIYGLKHIPVLKNAVASIGIFDGVHVGHQRIIKKMLKRCRKINGRSIIITFYPHPAKVLAKDFSGLLISFEHRLRILEQLRIDVCWIFKFDRRFAKKDPRRFIVDALANKLRIKELVISEDFNFGKGACGDRKLLEKLSRDYNFKLHCIDLVKRYNHIVSSTFIRRLIESGNLNKARTLLGRPPSLLGQVKPGQRRGRLLGYPTANLNFKQEVIPPSGVYAVKLKISQRIYSGMLNIGTKPTFATKKSFLKQQASLPAGRQGVGRPTVFLKQKPAIEVHIFKLDKNIYGKNIEVFFIKKLRDEKKFSSSDKLITQLKKDKIRTHNLFKSLKLKKIILSPPNI